MFFPSEEVTNIFVLFLCTSMKSQKRWKLFLSFRGSLSWGSMVKTSFRLEKGIFQEDDNTIIALIVDSSYRGMYYLVGLKKSILGFFQEIGTLDLECFDESTLNLPRNSLISIIRANKHQQIRISIFMISETINVRMSNFGKAPIYLPYCRSLFEMKGSKFQLLLIYMLDNIVIEQNEVYHILMSYNLSIFCYILNHFSMIYKTAPAWSFKGKIKESLPLESPSPLTYNPQVATTLAKSPSWKVGKEIRQKNKQERSPSPASYNPPEAEKSQKMGIIGKDVRGKENKDTSPGPGSYHISYPKESSSMSFACKYEFTNKTLGFPGPGNYQIPEKKQKRGASIGRQARFTDVYLDKKNQPGPGSYTKFCRPSSANVRFTKAPRMSHESNNTVGPGQYNITGEFQSKGKGFTLSSKHYTSHGDLTPGPTSYSPTHYDLTSSPSIGLGRKYKVKEAERSPSPNQYDPHYEKVFFKTESYSLGKAERQPLYGNCQSPGPGAYLSTEYTNNGVELSLGLSRKIEEREDFPGPGAYNPKNESIQKRPMTAKIGTSKRFYKIKTQASPSFYESKPRVNSPQYSFSKKKKLNDKSLEGPGPGAYNIPSSMCNFYPNASCKQ